MDYIACIGFSPLNQIACTFREYLNLKKYRLRHIVTLNMFYPSFITHFYKGVWIFEKISSQLLYVECMRMYVKHN